MKLPRAITGNDLAQALRKLDYTITRQTGSHIRLSALPVFTVSLL